MKKTYRFSAALLLLLSSLNSFSQSHTLSGAVKNSASKEFVSAVSVIIKGTTEGTFTDSRGNFKLTTSQSLPLTLVFSSIGFETKELQVTGTDPVEAELTPSSVLGEEIVIAATRTATKAMESPVTIERVSAANIRNTPATSYYDMVAQLKGVDVTTSSLTFKTPSTRGFNFSGNTRLNQLVDGMDNQAPGLNFPVGNFTGLTELDVDNMELLPGASSALYGSGGVNGTLLINSKDPFKYQGLSFQIKTGMNHVDKRQRGQPGWYNDWSARWAKAFNNKFAFKMGFQLVQAKDWIASSTQDYDRLTRKTLPGNRQTDPNYDGINVYGDETNMRDNGLSMKSLAQLVQGQTQQGVLAATGGTVDIVQIMNAALPPNATPAQIGGFISSLPAALQGPVTNMVPFYFGLRNNIIPEASASRTGYAESDMVNPNTINFKLTGSLQYKITSDLEASLTGYFGTGSTVYTGSDRYSLKDAKIGQYKLELRSKSWFVRGYTTQEDAGEAYNATITARRLNEAWKPSTQWFPEYVAAFVQARGAGADEAAAHTAARAFADQGMPAAGSVQFKQLFNQVRSTPIPAGGLFLDRSDLWMTEGQYNFKDVIPFIELVVGASWKQYILNSKGTLFIDYDGPIAINEYGAYGQLTKKLMKDRLTLSVSGRYDKNDNFKGRFTPRASAVVKLADDHNVRLSYQTAYRFPSTQQQYINLEIGGGQFLIGGLPWIHDASLPGGRPGPNLNAQTSVRLDNNAQPLGTYNPRELKPESVASYEIGYKGLIAKKLLVDIYYYTGEYDNFIGRTLVARQVAPQQNQIYSIVENAATMSSSGGGNVKIDPIKVKTSGYGIGLDYRLSGGLSVFANYFHDELGDVPADFIANFNTPDHRINFGVGHTGFGKNKRVVLNVTGRWQTDFLWEGDFATGTVPSFFTMDAMIGYRFPAIGSLVKLGATNVLNKYYMNGFGNPEIGGLYYVSFAYNVF
ncbi:TonB-dependent receptor [Agriterribacter sp.]|uniref:TonB-dependent receptor n=1 Tax=Agriterribacter sp. TaxID=2821509 RepID=UPI002BB56C2A|nr:TonB-dependent receptor [Agriterribacter sp.]HTN05162.1 TonB-dependent receptor [Agriterribacter sp.]